MVDDAADQRVAPDRETLEKRVAWQKKMHAAGWVGISWPKEYGGRGAGFMQQVIFDKDPPALAAGPGRDPGPAGRPAAAGRRKRHHLPRILAGEERWCQGFSEPGAGGDLASLRTRAVEPRRPFPRQRPEGMDLGRAFADRRFLFGAHRPRSAQASRHQLSAGRYEDAGRHGAPAGAAERPPAFQRGSSSRMSRCRRRIWSASSTKAGGSRSRP